MQWRVRGRDLARRPRRQPLLSSHPLGTQGGAASRMPTAFGTIREEFTRKELLRSKTDGRRDMPLLKRDRILSYFGRNLKSYALPVEIRGMMWMICQSRYPLAEPERCSLHRKGNLRRARIQIAMRIFQHAKYLDEPLSTLIPVHVKPLAVARWTNCCDNEIEPVTSVTAVGMLWLVLMLYQGC